MITPFNNTWLSDRSTPECSQSHEGWLPVLDDYDDGGFSGGNMQRPALQRLIDDIEAGKVQIVVVYKLIASVAHWPTLPAWWMCLIVTA